MHFFFFVATRNEALSESPVRHRTSVSSLEEIHPEQDDSSKPLRGALDKLSTRFNNLRESFTSSHDQDNTVWMARSDYAYDVRLLFKRRIRNQYIAFTNLRSYVEINYSGFRKIIKKYVFDISFYAFDCLSSPRL
jgi:phosphate transporter